MTSHIFIDVSKEVKSRILEVLEHFPELDGRPLTFKHVPDQAHPGVYDPLTYTISYRDGLPEYQTLGHEVMHAAQHQNHDLPATDRATDLFTFARGEIFTDDPGSYLEVPGRSWWTETGDRSKFDLVRPHLHQLAKEALQERENGNRRYIQWFEQRLMFINP